MNFDPITSASLAVQIHLATALVALALGTVMWLRPKGTKSHKIIGKIFIIFMLVTAVSAIFIRLINNGQFSFIHLFVPLTFLGVFNALWSIRKRNIKKHINAVKGMFFGALLIPGLLSFIPGRTLWAVFFGG